LEDQEDPEDPENNGDYVIGKGLKGFLYKKLKKKEPEKPKTRAGMIVHALKEEEKPYTKFHIEYPSRMMYLPTPKPTGTRTITYALLKPFSYANIKYDTKESTMVYNIIEPGLNDYEKYVLVKIKEGLIQTINVNLEDIKKHEKILGFLEENVQKLIYDYGFDVNDKEYMKIMYYVFRDFVGLDEIESLLADPLIEDIGCDGLQLPIYVVHQKFGSMRTNIIFNDEKRLKEFVTKLAERCDRYISYAEPLLDGSLPDGTRVQASLAKDVTTRGPTFSLRKFRELPLNPIDMIRLKTASSDMLAYIWFIVENGANILITGGVSTGKTCFLNSISLFIPQEAKIVSIEDTRELNLPHENWIPGVARTGFTGTGVGEVTMFELLKESFRQNPDYLIVGEIRGKEAYVMFQGMASGHPSMSTIHAGSVDDLMKRLQTHPISLSPGLLESLNAVIVMTHAKEKGKSARRIKEIDEIESIDTDTGIPRVLKTFVWLPHEDNYEYRGNSWLLGKIAREKGFTFDTVLRDISKRKKLLDWMVENNIINLNDVIDYIRLYRISPEKAEAIMNGKDHFRKEYIKEIK